MRSALILLAFALAWVLPLSAAQTGGKEQPKSLTPAEAARKALDQKTTLDFVGQSLQEAVNHLREKTKVNFILDNQAAQGMAIGPDGQPLAIQLKVTDGKVRQALQNTLTPLGLTYVILRDGVLITHEQFAHHRQMQQRVSLDLDGVPLRDALKQLARETGANLIIDPSVTKKAGEGVTLQLDDTSLETAVRLLTEMGGLKSVRLGNVLFVTSEDKATKLRQETQQPGWPHPGPQYVPPMVNFPGGVMGGGFGGGIAPQPAQVVVPDRPVRAVPPAPPAKPR
jgi:type II secretory pathway component GspD/PulD (secretin)